MKRIFGVLLVIGLLGGCAAQPPRWAGQMWSAKGRMYFTGISQNCSTVSCAYRQAHEASLVAISQYIGSQLSVHTTGHSDNNGTELETEVEIVTRPLELEKIQVEKFETVKRNAHWTGYIQVSVTASELARAKSRWQEREQERARRRQTVIHVKGERKLVSGVTASLRQAGFQTGKSERVLTVRQTEFSCGTSHLQNVRVGTLNVRICLDGKQTDFQTRGYAETCDKARAEAARQIGREVADWLEEFL